MATGTLVSVSEYLNTSYRPDQELLDGQLSQRNVDEYDHSNLPGALITFMRRHEREWNIRVLPEQRIQCPPCAFVFRMCVSCRASKNGNRLHAAATDLYRNTFQKRHAQKRKGHKAVPPNR